MNMEPDLGVTALVSMNVRVRDLELSVDDELNKIAAHTRRHKWEVIRDAMREYAERHKIVTVEKASA